MEPPEDFVRYLVLLTKPEGLPRDEAQIRRHIAHLRKLDQAGHLILCGPFLDANGGMLVLRARSLDHATELMLADPFIQEGARTFEIRTVKLSCEGNNHLGMG